MYPLLAIHLKITTFAESPLKMHTFVSQNISLVPPMCMMHTHILMCLGCGISVHWPVHIYIWCRLAVRPNLPITRLQECLVRSGNLPIDILVIPPLLTSLFQNDSISHLLPALFDNVHRWWSFLIVPFSLNSLIQFGHYSPPHTTTPLLVSLSLDSSPDTYDNAASLAFRFIFHSGVGLQTPLLSSVALDFIGAPIYALSLSCQIVSLTLRCMPNACNPSPLTWSGFLEGCVFLQFSAVEFSTQPPHKSPGYYHVSASVKVLKLSFAGGQSSAVVMCSFLFSGIVNLTLRITFHGNYNPVISAFLHAQFNQPHLRVLSLQGFPSLYTSTFTMAHIYASCPSLDSLKLDSTLALHHLLHNPLCLSPGSLVSIPTLQCLTLCSVTIEQACFCISGLLSCRHSLRRLVLIGVVELQVTSAARSIVSNDRR